jgi:hypothetical protein
MSVREHLLQTSGPVYPYRIRQRLVLFCCTFLPQKGQYAAGAGGGSASAGWTPSGSGWTYAPQPDPQFSI